MSDEPYPILTLGDVLTADELITQPFAATTALSDWRMPERLRGIFAQMGPDERRGYVRTAISAATAQRWDLQSALAVLLEWAGEVPPSVRNGAS